MKYIRAQIIFIVIIVLIASSIRAEDISSDIYPSEEEIYEAYLRGLIEYETYLNLSELIRDGIDESELYLLEEIPNLYFIGDSTLQGLTDTEEKQVESFVTVKEEKPKGKIHGYLKTRGYIKVEEDGASRRDMVLRTTLNEEWSTDIMVDEDYLGNKSIERRSFIYKSRFGPVRKMVVGNYIARFGLGLTVGYRGQFLDKDDQEFEKTIAFPEYGGFNGLYIEGGRNKDEIKFMAHYDRDDYHAFKTAALNLVKKTDYFRFEAIGLGSFIENRTDGIEYKYYQFGAYGSYTGRELYSAVEIAYGKDNENVIPAALFEAAYKNDLFRIELSGWRYDDDYINIAGGGRAGSMYQTVDIDTVDFAFRDKRVDQAGILLKTRTKFNDDTRYNVSFTLYGQNQYERNIRFLNDLDYRLKENHWLKIDYRYDRRERYDGVATESEIRFGYRLRSPKITTRIYAGLCDDDNGSKYLSLFNRTKFSYSENFNTEIWLNLDKFNRETMQNDYFYSYLKETFKMASYIEVAAKYTYRYSRNYSDRTESIFMIEAKALW